ncbi:MAG: gliding motility-associated ABC transporter ATP-binding subunit GldA [Ferruginibacter sp.]
MSISVNNISKHYGSQKAVNQISFTVNRREIVGFLGPNGAGKSTTMKMITGYLAADAGSIEVCGIPVTENSIETKKKIGYLPEANPMYADMYVREYLQFVSNVHHIKNAGKRIEEVINIVGLMPESNKKIGQLSKGYKQRVGLAAALIHDPEVLILDEPTSGLDPNQIIEIREVIRSLGKNKTVLFSSHILQEVQAICDRVIIISNGNIVADDTLQNLQQNSSSQQLVIVEFKEPVEEEIFKKLAGVMEIKNIQNGYYNIQCLNADELKKQLLKLSIEHNLDIVSLKTETQNLESVFRSLTT